MNIIIFKNKDKSCGIIYPSASLFEKDSKDRVLLRNKGIDFSNDEEIIRWIAKKDVPAGLPYRITKISNIPENRCFREAWHDENLTETVDIDIEKAKKVKKNELRKVRAEIFIKLDIDFQKALEEGDNIKRNEIIKKKQELRDITKLDFPDDLEELKNFFPKPLQLK